MRCRKAGSACVVLPAGYMMPKRHNGKDIMSFDTSYSFSAKKEGKISGKEYQWIEDNSCLGNGACPMFGTALTMAAVAESWDCRSLALRPRQL